MSIQLKYIQETLAHIHENGYETNQLKFLKSTAIFLAKQFDVDYVLIDKYSIKNPTVTETVVMYFKEKFLPNFTYKLKNTPCEKVINNKICCYSTNVSELFPEDESLIQMNIDSYIGIPLLNSKKEPIGLIALMDDKPIKDAKTIETVLGIIAVKVEKALEKMLFDTALNLKIKQLKIAKRAAEANAEKFKKLSNLTFEGILIHDKGLVIDINLSLSKMMGYKPEELIGKNIIDLAVPEKYHQIISESILKENTLPYEIEGIKKDGTVLPLEIEARSFTSDCENILRVAAVRDLTERKKAEENLKKSEKKYRFLFENHPQPKWIYDLETLAFLEVNSAAIQHYGYTREEFLSMTLKDIRPKENIELLLEDIEIAKRVGYNPSSEWLHIKKNGEIINVNVVSHKVTINNREARHILVNDITASKKAEQELLKATIEIEKSEQKFRDLFEKSRDAILIVKNGLFVECNQAAVDLLGYKKQEDILNLHPSELSPKFQPDGLDSEEKSEEIIKITLEKGSHRFDWWLTKNNGGIFPVEVLLTNILNEPSNNIIHCVLRDITERKEIEQELLHSGELNKSITQSAGDSIISINSDGIVLSWNNASEKIFGYKASEMINNNLDKIMGSQQRIAHNLGLKRLKNEAISKPLNKAFETTGIRKDGAEFPIDLKVSSWEVDNQKYYTGIVRDITERKKAEQELLKAKEKAEESEYNLKNRVKELAGIYALQQLTEKYADPITIYNVLVTVIIPNSLQYTDKVCCELEINNKTYSNNKNYKIPKTKNYLLGKIWVNEKQIGNLKVAYMEDLPFIANYEANLIETFATKLSAFLYQQDLLEKLIKAKEKAEESDALKTEFIQNMSHEIRTPMNGILGFTELLSNQDLSEEKREKFIDIIKNSTHQLMHVIDDLMEISVLESKQIKVEEQPVCINKLLYELHAIFNIKATKNNTVLVLKNSLSDQESTMLTDKNKLTKVLSNLLENALKFTTEGTVELGYKLNNDREPTQMEIYVKDSGIGIKPEKQLLIFERFSQAEKSLSKKVGGLGLGLSIAKENTELLGGKISVVSELGKGAIFFINIPYKPLNLVSKIETEEKKLQKPIKNIPF